MRAVAALAARLPEVGRHVPGLLARRFRVRFEAPPVCADHRPPALHAGEQKLKTERNPVRQDAGARDGQCSAKFDFRRRVLRWLRLLLFRILTAIVGISQFRFN
jgi:hypothetical protein